MSFKLANPWPDIKYEDHLDVPLWNVTWSGVDEQIDPFMEAANYYLLFGVSTNSFVKFTPLKLPDADEVNAAIKLLGVTDEQVAARAAMVEEILAQDRTIVLESYREQAEHLFQERVTILDTVFREYCHMAIGGELRHHDNIGTAAVSKNRRMAWSQWAIILERYGIEALKDAAKLFRDFPKGGSYGSEAWAVAAELLFERENGTLGPSEFVNKQMFVDRVFTLQHNTGAFINKINWATHRSAPYNQHIGEMPSTVLDYQHSNPPNIVGLWHFASGQVQELVKNYLEMAKDNGLVVEGNWKVEDALVSNKTPSLEKKKAPSAKKAATKLTGGQSKEEPSETFYDISTPLDSSILEPPGHSMCNIYVDLYYGAESVHRKYEMSFFEFKTKNFYWKHMVKNTQYKGQQPTAIDFTLEWKHTGAVCGTSTYTSFGTGISGQSVWNHLDAVMPDNPATAIKVEGQNGTLIVSSPIK